MQNSKLKVKIQKSETIILILGIIAGLIITLFFLSYLLGINLSMINICMPGSKPDIGFGFISINKNCYIPGVNDGKVCSKKLDCGKEYCVFENLTSKTGICKNHLEF